MKNTLKVALLTAIGIPTGAWAQASSVQIYGQATAAVTHVTNQTGDTSLTSLGNSLFAASLLGLRGTEDLGGGMSAVFRLEAGFNMDTGNVGAQVAGTTKFFNRQSFVGLNLNPQVSLTLGRQFHASTDRVIQTMDVYQVSGTSLAVAPLGLFGVNRFVGNDTRADDSIKLRVRGPAGLVAGYSHAMRELGGKSHSFDLAQVTKDYSVGAYYVTYDAPTVIAATGVRPEHTAWGLGGNALLGPVRLYAHLMRSSLDATVAGRGAQENRIVHLGLSWPVGALTTVKAAYYHDKGETLNGFAGRDGTKKTAILSADYALSKRTTLHAGVFSNRFTDGYKLDPVNIAALGRNPSASSTSGITMGMRHDF